MEAKTEQGQVWQELLRRGLTNKKICYEWKKKGYFLAGKANFLAKEYEAAIENIENALKLGAAMSGSTSDKEAIADEAKLKEMLQMAQKKRAAELKKEKQTWSKAFEKNKEESEPRDPVDKTSLRDSLPIHSMPEPANGVPVDLSKCGFYGNILGFTKGQDGTNIMSTINNGVDEEKKNTKRSGVSSTSPEKKNEEQTNSALWAIGFGVIACVATITTFAFMRSRRS